MIQDQAIEVLEDDEPLLSFTIRRTSGGVVSPYNLTGLSVRFTVRDKRADSDTPMAEYTSADGGGITVTDAVNGRISVQITTNATSKPGTYSYYLAVITSGRAQTVLKGAWKVLNK